MKKSNGNTKNVDTLMNDAEHRKAIRESQDEKDVHECRKEIGLHVLALKKWEWRVDNWDFQATYEENNHKMLNDLPELLEHEYYCAYCTTYYYKPLMPAPYKMYCYDECPLKIINQHCVDKESFHHKFYIHGASDSGMFLHNNEDRIDLSLFYADMLRDTIRCLKENAESRLRFLLIELIEGRSQ